MSRQQIEISKLMNNYIDDEFNIAGKAAANARAVKNRVMEQVEPKKRFRISTKAIVIAAAVAVTGIMTAAVLPYGILQSQNNMHQFEFSEFKSEVKDVDDYSEEEEPYTLENGKIYFTALGQHIDITDYIERGENFYYQYSVEDNQGDKYIRVIAVGGDIDNPAYGETVYQDKLHGLSASYFYGGSEVYCYYKDGEVIMVDSEEKRAECSSYPHRNIDSPCLKEFEYHTRIWDNDNFYGREINVSEADRTRVFESEITDWLYPEGWSGETVPEGLS